MMYPKTIMLTPRKGAQGHVRLPGSKSISNRVLLLAALAQGATQLRHVLDSDDTQVMIDSLKKLGVSISSRTGGDDESANSLDLLVQGVGGVFPTVGTVDAPLKLFIGNSGLTIRTLVPALVVSMAKSGGCVEISGVERMHERPIADLVDGLKAIGARIEYLGTPGFPPLRIVGAPLSAQPKISVKGSTSSQYLTGLMQAAPLLALQWQQPIALAVDGELISKPYVEITRAVLRRFGVQIDQTSADPMRYVIAPAMIQAAGDLTVEGDASSASYFLAAGAIGHGPVRVIGAGRDSVQGDVRFADALE